VGRREGSGEGRRVGVTVGLGLGASDGRGVGARECATLTLAAAAVTGLPRAEAADATKAGAWKTKGWVFPEQRHGRCQRGLFAGKDVSLCLVHR